MKYNRVGITNIHKSGEIMTIINYLNKFHLDVMFEDGTIVYDKPMSSFRKGIITKPKLIYGVGYLGEGKYNSRENGIKLRSYQCWHAMLRRCYSEKRLKDKPTYINCFVCEEWYDYQNFAKWYDENYYEIITEQMDLDKDILFKNNKIYSPETCIFAPQSINKLFTKANIKRGNFPIGVSYDNRENKFVITRCGYQSDGKYYFNCIEEAFSKYKALKEEHIKEIANKYKDKIPKKLYIALLNYEVDIDD